MDVSVDVVDGQVVSLVASTSDSLDINRLDLFKDFLHISREVGKRGGDTCHFSGVGFTTIVQVAEALNLASHLSVEVLLAVVRQLESAVFTRTEVCDGLLAVGVGEDLVNDADAGVPFDGEADEDGDAREVALHEIAGSIKGINPNDSIISAERAKFLGRNLISREAQFLEVKQSRLLVLLLLRLKIFSLN